MQFAVQPPGSRPATSGVDPGGAREKICEKVIVDTANPARSGYPLSMKTNKPKPTPEEAAEKAAKKAARSCEICQAFAYVAKLAGDPNPERCGAHTVARYNA